MDAVLAAGGTRAFYDAVYKTYPTLEPDSRYDGQRASVRAAMSQIRLSRSASVVEIGAGLGYLANVHPNFIGIEHSAEAVRRVRETYGHSRNVIQGDATALDFPDASVDFVFSFDTLEHVPQVDRAFAEVARILKPGGHAYLAPAWNCRPWTVKKLQQRPYRALPWRQKVGKFLNPLRDHIGFRAVNSLPGRIRREVALALGLPIGFEWKPLTPELPDQVAWKDGLPVTSGGYPHLPDEDAYASIDGQAALTWFATKGFELLSHPTVRSRMMVRAEGILVRKGPVN